MVSKGASIYIDNSSLIYGVNYNLNIKAKFVKKCALKGTVNDKNNNPIERVTVEVREVDVKNNTETILGYCFTDSNGEYIFILSPKNGLSYDIYMYSPFS